MSKQEKGVFQVGLNRRQFLQATGVVFGTAMLAGCGGAGGSAPAAGGGDPIRIGVLTPLTGAGGSYGQGMQTAIKLAADEINASGGVLGRKIQLFSEDDQTDPQAAVNAAKKLIEVNKVQAILGTWASAVSMAVAPLCIKAGVVHLNTSGTPDLTTLKDDDWVYRLQASNVLFGEAFGAAAIKRGFKTAATMANNNPSGLGIANEFRKFFEKLGGKVLEQVVYNDKQTSFKAELEKVLAAKPEVIILGSYTPDAIIIAKEAYQMGAKVKWIGPAFALNAKFIDGVGKEVAEGMIALDGRAATDSPGYAKFKAAYEKAMKADPFSNPYAAMTWDMMNLVALALQASGEPTAAGIRSKLREVSRGPGKAVTSFAEGMAELKAGRTINYQGASGKCDFDQAGDVQVDFSVFEIRGGKPVEVDVVRF